MYTPSPCRSRKQRLPRRAAGADPRRHRPPSRAQRRLARLCARARPADRGDRQHPLAPRSQHRQHRDPRRFPERAALCQQRDRGRADRLLRREPAAAPSRRSRRDRFRRARAPEIRRAFDAMDHPERLRPTRPVTRSGSMTIAGRRLQVNLAALCRDRGRRLALRSGDAAGDRRRPRRRAGAVHGHGLRRGLARGAGPDRGDARSPP